MRFTRLRLCDEICRTHHHSLRPDFRLSDSLSEWTSLGSVDLLDQLDGSRIFCSDDERVQAIGFDLYFRIIGKYTLFLTFVRH